MTVQEPQPVDGHVAELHTHCDTLASVLQQLTDGGAAGGEAQQGLLTTGALALLDIKGAHRTVFEAGEAARAVTAEKKAELEALALTLANLRYQRAHHESDIAACLDARSAYSTSDVSLLPEAEFRELAGDKWTAGLQQGDDHALMVARLKHEAAARQELLTELQRTRAQKDGLAAAVAQKRRFADGLAAELGSVREAAGLLRGSLSVAPLGVALPPRAEQLPLPLYIALAQLLAARGSFDTPIEACVIERSTAAAPAVVPAAAAAAAPQPQANGDTEMSDALEEGEEPEEGEEGSLPAATAAGRSGPSPAALAPLEEATQQVPLEPLAVEIALGSRGARLLTIALAYSAAKHAVYASGTDEAEARALAAADAPPAGSKGTAATAAAVPSGPHPYKWAQRLAGIDFVPPPPAGLPPPTVSDADGHVLAGLAEQRQGGVALKTLEALRAAQRATAVAAGGK